MYGYYKQQHKVFISFHHYDDQKYKDYIDNNICSNVIYKSVTLGEYSSDNSEVYIKRLIREEIISDSSVGVVLVATNTKNRKHVDWEIYAGLRVSVNGSSGFVGIFLPTMRKADGGKDYYVDMPGRLADNICSGYADFYDGDYVIDYFDSIIERDFNNRIERRSKINNSRIQMQRNL